MENLRLGVSAVQHDMKREETVEEVEKNTELVRRTPKSKLYFASFLYEPHRVISLWAMLSDSAKSR